MSTTLQEAPIVSNESNIILEIRSLFDHYASVFIDLVLGKRTDIDKLFDYFSTPLRIIAPTFHRVIMDNPSMIDQNALGGEIKRLQQAGLASSTLEKCQISVISPAAALVDTIWLRHDNAGSLIAKIGVAYFVTKTAEGWRITSVINTF